MNTADVNARLRRLRELADGFRAELELIPKLPWPLNPYEVQRYEKAIRDAQQALTRAHGTIQMAVGPGLARR
jgi:hypothetical protein